MCDGCIFGLIGLKSARQLEAKQRTDALCGDNRVNILALKAFPLLLRMQCNYNLLNFISCISKQIVKAKAKISLESEPKTSGLISIAIARSYQTGIGR